jgi:AcrR family transcriptional regulator
MTRELRQSRRPPGRPAARSEGQTRELLLTAATQLFAEHGAAATSFALIAQRVGLTPAVVHYYFRERDDLLDAVVDERLAPLIASVWDPVCPNDAVPNMVRGVVDRLLAGVEHNPWVPSTWMREILNPGGLLRTRVLRRLPLDKVRMIGQAVVRGQQDGAIYADLDPVLLVFSMLGLVMLHMATASLVGEVFRTDVPSRAIVARHITGVLLHGLERPAVAPSRSAHRKARVRRRP